MAEWESIGKVRAIRVGKDIPEMVEIFIKKIGDNYFFAAGEDHELVDTSFNQAIEVVHGRSVSWHVYIPLSIFIQLGIISK